MKKRFRLKQWQFFPSFHLYWDTSGPNEFGTFDRIVIIGPLQLWFWK